MASGEAEPLQYTTTVLRVSIHCEGCKKKVKKVLHNIEGVYRVTVDAAQHKVTVTASVGADALVRRLHKAGKQAALWPAPATAPPAAAKKPEEVAPPPPPPAAVEGDKADAKTKEAAKDKNQQPEAEGGKVEKKKPEKDKGSSDKKSEKAEAAKPKEDDEPENKDVEVTPQPKVTEPAKASAAAGGGGEEAGAEEPSSGGKKGKKKKNKQQQPKEGGEPEAAPAEKAAPQPSMPPAALPVVPSSPAPPPPPPGPERPLGGGGGLFPYYAAAAHAPVVMSYNVAHPSSSVSYYAPTPVGPSPAAPPPPQHQVVPYGYPPMVMVPEFVYGPPGVRSSPPQESYNNMFNEENANSCSVM